MNHAITIGGLLEILAILAGLALAGFGLIEFLAADLADDPMAGNAAGEKGCSFGIAGILIVVIAAVLLAACAHGPEARVETVEVRIPVAVQPIKPADVPTPPPPLGPRPATLPQAADALLSQVCELEAYVIRAVPLLSVSAGLPPVQAPAYPECAKH